MVEFLIIGPPIIAFIVSTLSYILILKTYFQRRYPELLQIGIGFIMYTAQPISIIFVALAGESASKSLVSFIAGMSYLFIILAFLIVFNALKSLNGEKSYNFREKLMVLTSMYGLGYLTGSFYTPWEHGRWNLKYSPEYAIVFYIISLSWLIIEVLMISYRGYSNSISSKIIFTGWLIEIISILLVLVERQFRSDTFLYLIVTSIGYIFIAIALLKEPEAIIPRNLGGEYIIISERFSGLPLIQTSIEEKEDQSIIFSAGMTGILSMLKELIGEEDIPSEIGYKDKKILFEQSDRYICYFIGSKAIQPIRIVIRQILEIIESKDLDINRIEKYKVREINTLIQTKLYFTT